MGNFTPQIDADDLKRRLRRRHDVEYGMPQARLKRSELVNPDGPNAAATLTTLRAEKQALANRVFELEEFAENVRHESCQALAGKDT